MGYPFQLAKVMIFFDIGKEIGLKKLNFALRIMNYELLIKVWKGILCC